MYSCVHVLCSCWLLHFDLLETIKRFLQSIPLLPNRDIWWTRAWAIHVVCRCTPASLFWFPPNCSIVFYYWSLINFTTISLTDQGRRLVFMHVHIFLFWLVNYSMMFNDLISLRQIPCQDKEKFWCTANVFGTKCSSLFSYSLFGCFVFFIVQLYFAGDY